MVGWNQSHHPVLHGQLLWKQVDKIFSVLFTSKILTHKRRVKKKMRACERNVHEQFLSVQIKIFHTLSHFFVSWESTTQVAGVANDVGRTLGNGFCLGQKGFPVLDKLQRQGNLNLWKYFTRFCCSVAQKSAIILACIIRQDSSTVWEAVLSIFNN